MTRQTFYVTRPPFVVDPGSIDRNSGRQIDWDSVPESYRAGSSSITAATTGAEIGATTLPVLTVPKALPDGFALNFGEWAAVTVTGKAADAGATTLPVVALPGPLPAGIVLDFAAGLVQVAAAAASGATGISVAALGTTAVTGETATFAGGPKTAVLSANAAAAATITNLAVVPLALPITGLDVATINGTGAKTLPAGKVMVELTGGKIVPRSDRPGSEVAMGLLETNAIEGDVSAALTGHGVIVGGVIYENLLPDAAAGTTGALTDAYKQELVGNTSQPKSTGFVFEQYADNRS